MVRRVAVVLALWLAVCGVARAQLGLYVMGSGGRLGAVSGGNSFTAWGGTVGGYDNFFGAGPLKLGGDARFFVQSSGNSNAYGNQLRGGMVGVRLALNPPILPLKPYVQAEVGAASTNYGVQANRALNFAYQVQGGVDWTIFPHVDVRAEYGGGNTIGSLGGTSTTLQEFGGGIVLRL
jgi:hypothetical protein